LRGRTGGWRGYSGRLCGCGRGGIAAGGAAAGEGFFAAGVAAGRAAHRGEEAAAAGAGFGVALDFIAAVVAKKTGLLVHWLRGLGGGFFG